MNLLFAVLPFALLASDKICTKHLDRLLALHQECGLPLPPREAKLVRFVASDDHVGYDAGRASRSVCGDEADFGFSLDGRTVLGNFNELAHVRSISPVKAENATFSALARPDLLLAIQFHARGFKSLSHQMYRLWLADIRQERPLNETWGEEALVEMAWEHWMFRLTYDPRTPLPVVAKYLKRIRPRLDRDEDESEFVRELLRDLDLALIPQNSRPGSDEALIDDLIHITGSQDGWLYQNGFRANRRYQAALDRGFAIVPTLINYLGDDRLTRLRLHIHVGLKVWVPCDCRVRDIAWDILCTLAGESLAKPNADLPTRIDVAIDWFKTAHKVGEEKYILARVLSDEDQPSLDDNLFWMVSRKYPKRLPELYRKLIEHKAEYLSQHSWQFAKAIANGPLPDAEKRKILEFAARQTNPHHRAAGLNFLRRFEPEQARELLVAGLGSLSGRVPDGGLTLAELAAAGSDPREWQALAKAIRRADVGSRLELLKVMAEEPSLENRTLRLKFLAEYLTDDAVRDKKADPKRFDFFATGQDFEQLDVRDYAAWELARLLKLDLVAQVDWKAKDWAEFRAKVRRAVAKELNR